MMFWYDHDPGAWGWVGMTVGMLLFWGLLISAVVLLVRAIGPGGPTTPTPPTSDPERLLAERFARGEIDEPEFQDRLATLRGTTRPGGR
ncbi:SHOCT domain-containing protein [Trujillonella endophytica]|uniref:Putative membrane protein n=1 Tax=Trujillonella endophytica TaxID=673521 RepID=A0A1H8W8D9_9ACTN|nr:SHOCT domain-containing protein [Trujillella endophytica]SEP23912.1 putative membrane protein [Trujillella endophytica]